MFVSILVPACATPLSAYMLNPETYPPPECPASTHLSGVGSSLEGPDIAEKTARADISRKIGSVLMATLRAEVSETRTANQDGVQLEAREDRLDAVEEKTTFAYAELIRTVGPTEFSEGRAYVLVCLSRKEAASRLLDDLRPVAERARSAATRARTAAAARDRRAFASSWRELQTHWAAGRPLLAQVRGLVGTVPLHVEWDSARKELTAEAEALRKSVAFKLEVRAMDLPPEQRSSLVSSVEKALSSLGPIRGGGACSPGGTEIAVAVEARGNCRRGSLGYVCEPEVTAIMEDCGGGSDPIEGTLSGDRLNGADPSNAARALRRALAPITTDGVESKLTELLSTLTPL